MKNWAGQDSKLEGMNKWEAFLPYLFILYLLIILIVHQQFIVRLTRRLTDINRNLRFLDNIDTYVLESHNNLKGYQLTQNGDYLDGIHNSLRNVKRVTGRLKEKSDDPIVHYGLNQFDENYGRWIAYSNDIVEKEKQGIDTREITKTRTGHNLIRPLRVIVEKTAANQLRKKSEILHQLESVNFITFFGILLGLLIFSIFYIRNFNRNRRWALAIQASEEQSRMDKLRLRGLLESAYDLILISNDKGIIQFVNKKFCESTGYSIEECIGQPVEMLVPDKFLIPFLELKNQYLLLPVSKAIGSEGHLCIKTKDHFFIPIEVSLSPFCLGGEFQIAAILRDISERTEFETRQRLLAEVGKILNTSLEAHTLIHNLGEFCLGNLADWCVIIPKSGNISLIKKDKNSEAQFIEYLRSDLPLCERVFDVIDGRKNIVINDITKEKLQLIQFTQKQLDSIIDMGIKSVVISPLLGRDELLGAVIHVRIHKNYLAQEVLFLEDIVSRASLALDNANLYQLAQESVKERDELMRIVSHDLKNPLTSVKLNGEMLKREVLKLEASGLTLLKRITAIETSANLAIGLIKDLLDTAKIETGGLKLDLKIVKANEIMQEVGSVFTSLAEESGVSLSLKVEGNENLSFVGDPDRIQQVISNLLGNALKYTPAGGAVAFTIKERPDGLLFIVKDNGPGIDKEKQIKLFQKYWKASEGKGHNLGLGLAIAKGIVEAHQGKIWLESSLGVGTAFYFSLPYGADSNSHISI